MNWSDWQNIRFAEPEKLQLLYVAAALFLLAIVAWGLKLFLRPRRTHGSRYPLFGAFKFWFSLSAVMALCVFAYARPFLPRGRVVITQGSAEVIFIVDYSASSFLKDTGMARIDIARREIMKSFSGGIIREGDRAAVLIFGKIVSPRLFLTRDIGLLATEIDKIGVPENLLGNDLFWGSAIASTFKRSYEMMDRQDMLAEIHKESKAWKPRPRQNRIIIIFSDGDFFNYGEDEDSKEQIEMEKRALQTALKELEKRNVPVFTIGVGTKSGARLTDILKDYKKGLEYDEKLAEELKGQMSRLNMVNLSNIAATTGGKSFSIENSHSDAGGFIKASIDGHRSVHVDEIPREERRELWLYFMFGALAVFISGMVITKF